MAHEAEIKCINKDDRYNPYQRIINVGGFTDRCWTISQQDAIGMIERGEWRFHVGSTILSRAEVIVAVSPYGNKYLKTVADDWEPNNLLNLPECQ